MYYANNYVVSHTVACSNFIQADTDIWVPIQHSGSARIFLWGKSGRGAKILPIIDWKGLTNKNFAIVNVDCGKTGGKKNNWGKMPPSHPPLGAATDSKCRIKWSGERKYENLPMNFIWFWLLFALILLLLWINWLLNLIFGLFLFLLFLI